MIKDTSTNGTFINGLKASCQMLLHACGPPSPRCFTRVARVLEIMQPPHAPPPPPPPRPPKQVGKGSTGEARAGDRVQLSVADPKAPTNHME